MGFYGDICSASYNSKPHIYKSTSASVLQEERNHLANHLTPIYWLAACIVFLINVRLPTDSNALTFHL